MKRILVLHTGGTIAMAEDSQTGEVSTEQSNPLLNFSNMNDTETELIVEDFLYVPSPHITPEHMLALKERVAKAATENFAGVVITHGTDTLEETAYFLDITVGDLLPIVVTGAMRSSNEIGTDGLYNFLTAIRVACDDQSQGKGVLVVMNDEIHTARYVTKTHTTNVATFRTPTFGPVGLVTKHKVSFYQQLLTSHTLDIANVSARIPIVKAYAGMDSEILDLLADSQIDGLVIEALGAGNLPPKTVPAIEAMIAKNIPVILVSRCFNGVAEGVYGYEGGGIQLEKKGVIFCNGLNSQKARIKLLVALNANLTKAEFNDFMIEKV
ncbi:asparaginase [Vagococcus coleopterorum]|uniref:asparaginase n=1 Tax=Vagococcus coleopterorum TaxID=2714946 RepID=A0A6G8APB2_9ENTE|nr:asparaginase [Vagococcus coleopterorum]QIL46918.1 asparaginase [Vagococcus coleopterorum]